MKKYICQNERPYFCNSCSKSGSRNSFYGKTHGPDYIKKLRSSRRSYIGKNNPFWGKSAWNRISDEERDDYKLYRARVISFTEQNNLERLENIHLRGKHGVPGAYQLDHRFSIIDGFRSGIAPWIVGNIVNLQMIPWEDNIAKRGDSSITKEELYELYEGR